jgi:NIMA (never in mitosis gene a)-related kinase
MEKFNRLQKLGEGASGKVYLIENRENKELSVAKQINAVINEKDRASAVQEAKLLKSMAHPNIVKLHDIFMTTSGKVLIIMDYADGGDLSQRIAAQRESSRGLLPEMQCLEWLVQAGYALWYLHGRKVLHRDIKTRNLFLYSSGLLKLGDFGISCVLETTVAMAHTVVGTLYYLSPELVNRTPYSFKSDVWALGVVLYELAALRQPFDSTSLHELLRLIIQGEYEPLDNLYSDDLKSLVRSMLTRDPSTRPAVAEMLRMPFLQSAFTNVNDRYSLDLEIPAERTEAADPLADFRLDLISGPGETTENEQRLITHIASPLAGGEPVLFKPVENKLAGGDLDGAPQRNEAPSQAMDAKRMMHRPPPALRPPCAPPPGPPPGAASHFVTPRLAAAANALPLLKAQPQSKAQPQGGGGGPRTVLRGAGMQVLMA